MLAVPPSDITDESLDAFLSELQSNLEGRAPMHPGVRHDRLGPADGWG